jgi:hypothetical protein
MIKQNFLRSWKEFLIYRIALCMAVVLVLGRLGVHVFYMRSILNPQQHENALPAWWQSASLRLPPDLQVYRESASRFSQQLDLYQPKPPFDETAFFQYSPAFTLIYSVTQYLSLPFLVVAMSVVNIFAYAGLFFLWAHIFKRYRIQSALLMLIQILPVWLLFSGFWIDLGLLNIHVIIALVASLLIYFILQEKLLPAVLILILLVQTKPYWGFLIMIPLLMGRYRFFFRLFILSVLGYIGIILITALMGGFDYVFEQYQNYFRITLNLSRDYPWRLSQDGFLGYNHAIKQVAYYIFGYSSLITGIVNLVKQLMLLPLVLVIIGYLIRPVRQPGWERPYVALDVAFGCYLGVYIFLDFFFELTLGIVVVVYLLSMEKKGWVRGFLWVLFISYALLDFWQTLSYLIVGPDVLVEGIYILTDPSIYFPITLFFLLALYIKMLVRLWRFFPTEAFMESFRQR